MPISHLPPACPVWWSPHSLGLCKAGWVPHARPPTPLCPVPCRWLPSLLGLCGSNSTLPHHLLLHALCRHLSDKKPALMLCVCVCVFFFLHGTPYPLFPQPPLPIMLPRTTQPTIKITMPKRKRPKITIQQVIVTFFECKLGNNISNL